MFYLSGPKSDYNMPTLSQCTHRAYPKTVKHPAADPKVASNAGEIEQLAGPGRKGARETLKTRSGPQPGAASGHRAQG
jgi:hypothetical protein